VTQKIVHILRARRAMVRSAGKRLSRRRVPRQTFPTGARVRYQALLTEMRRSLGGIVEEIVAALPALTAQAERERGGLRTDATVEELQALFARLRLIFLKMHPLATTQEILQGVAQTIDGKQAAEHQKQMKAALGVELVVPEPWRKAVVSDFVAQNQDLVTSLTDGALDSFKAITSSGIRQGLRVGDIAAQLEEKLGVTKGKAALLARDQTLKLFGEMTSLRQQNVGISQYTWDTSKDERVRGNPAGLYPNSKENHFHLEGTIQSWSEPPVVEPSTGRRAHPGFSYQCRCQGLPIIPEEYLQE
jgi:SPP1 gp7 family putative phage head morphogenesis protein